MKNKLFKSFLIKAAIIFVLWQVLYYGLIIKDGRVNRFLTLKVVEGTTIGLNLLGYETQGEGQTILIDGQPVVLVGDQCNGLELFVLFAGFIIAFPGRIVYKLIFIPAGIIMIFLINILREVMLSLNYKFFQASFDLNHKYTYVLVVYFFVFILWRFWLKKYSALAKS